MAEVRPNTANTYSNNQYRRDAAFLMLCRDDAERLPATDVLSTMITDEVYGMAKGVHLLSSTATKEANLQAAQHRIQQEPIDPVVRDENLARALITAFKNGPTIEEQGRERERVRGQNTEEQGRERERLRTSLSVDKEIQRNWQQGRSQEGLGRTGIPTRYRPPPREASIYSRYQNHRYSPPQRQNTRFVPYRSPPRGDRNYQQDDPFLQRSPTRSTQTSYRLKATDIGLYNGKDSVSVYVQRIVSMVNRYGTVAVLSTLPLCITEVAREWYDAIGPDTLEIMDNDVDEWVIQLRARFARNPIEAEEEANHCRFTFATEDRLDLRTYITRKQNLLVESGVEDPNQLINRIWKDLDPLLQNAVMPRPGLPLNAFIQDLYMQEYAARRLYRTYAVPERRTRSDFYGSYGDRSPSQNYGNRSPSNSFSTYGNRFPSNSFYPNRNNRSPNSYQNGNAYGNRYGGYGQNPRTSDQQYDNRGPPLTPPRRSIMAPDEQRAPFQPMQANPGANTNRQYNQRPPYELYRQNNGILNKGPPGVRVNNTSAHVHFADEKENVSPEYDQDQSRDEALDLQPPPEN